LQIKAALTVNNETHRTLLADWASDTKSSAAGRLGAKVIEQLAQDLKREFPSMSGFSPRNLKYMRAFAKAYPAKEFVQHCAAQIPWRHNQVLLDKLKTPEQRL